MFKLMGKKIFSILCSNWTYGVTFGKYIAAVIFPGKPPSFFPIRAKCELFFLFLNQNICCGHSKEPSHRDGSFEHPKHMFKLIGKKIFSILCSNWAYGVTLGKSRAAVIFPGLPSSFFPILNIRTVLWFARLTINALKRQHYNKTAENK